MGICGMALTLGSVEIFRWKKYEVTTKLPSGYTPVEYIQSSGSQYIKTGVYHNSTTCPTLRMVLDTAVSSSVGINGAASYQSYYVGYMSGYLYYSTYYGDVKTTVTYSAGTRRKHDLNNAAKTFAVYSADGTKVYETNTTVGTPSGSKELYLFAYNASDGGSIGAYSTQKMWPSQIYVGGGLVRDYFPCKNASGTFGLYDLANGGFYGNNGSGAFTGGAEVENIAVGEFIEEVKSLNSNAYPDGGVKDGYYYEKVV
jgi:hypothetical protein